jgi:hypothetical protein
LKAFDRASPSASEAGFGFAQYFIHPNRQTVHDRIAETIVVACPRKRHGAGSTPPDMRVWLRMMVADPA